MSCAIGLYGLAVVRWLEIKMPRPSPALKFR